MYVLCFTNTYVTIELSPWATRIFGYFRGYLAKFCNGPGNPSPEPIFVHELPSETNRVEAVVAAERLE